MIGVWLPMSMVLILASLDCHDQLSGCICHATVLHDLQATTGNVLLSLQAQGPLL